MKWWTVSFFLSFGYNQVQNNWMLCVMYVWLYSNIGYDPLGYFLIVERFWFFKIFWFSNFSNFSNFLFFSSFLILNSLFILVRFYWIFFGISFFSDCYSFWFSSFFSSSCLFFFEFIFWSCSSFFNLFLFFIESFSFLVAGIKVLSALKNWNSPKI